MILPVATVFAVTFSIERGIFMARKSRKHKYKEELKFLSSVAVGYIRLSVANKEESSSIENQKFIIECWGEQQQIPMSHYYIDNGFSGKFYDRPAFQEMIQDILSGNINCVVVKDDCVIIERKHRKPQKMRVLWCPFCFLTQNRG